jgi:hypothetical protein
MKENDSLILKVPQMISAQKLHRGGQYVENEPFGRGDVHRTILRAGH